MNAFISAPLLSQQSQSVYHIRTIIQKESAITDNNPFFSSGKKECPQECESFRFEVTWLVSDDMVSAGVLISNSWLLELEDHADLVANTGATLSLCIDISLWDIWVFAWFFLYNLYWQLDRVLKFIIDAFFSNKCHKSNTSKFQI